MEGHGEGQAQGTFQKGGCLLPGLAAKEVSPASSARACRARGAQGPTPPRRSQNGSPRLRSKGGASVLLAQESLGSQRKA